MATLNAATSTAAAAKQSSTGGSTDVKVCVPMEKSPAFLESCTAAVSKANTASLSFSCVAGGSPEACAQAIKRGAAHLTSFGAADVFTSHEEYGLEPIANEVYSQVSCRGGC